VDLFVDYLATMAVIQNRDFVRKNYNLTWQKDPQARWRWELLPWDLDLSFGCVYDDVAGDTICDSFVWDADWTVGQWSGEGDPGYGIPGHYNLLIHQVLSDAELNYRVQQRICAILDSSWWQRDLPRLASALSNHIWWAMHDDQNDLNLNDSDFVTGVEQLFTFMEQREAVLREELACDRIAQ
jgi:hypothetical protein